MGAERGIRRLPAARGASQQQVTCGAPRARCIDAVLEDPLGQAPQRGAMLHVRHDAERVQRLRVPGRDVRGPGEVHGIARVVDVEQLAPDLPGVPPGIGLLPVQLRVVELVAAADVVVLRAEPVAPRLAQPRFGRRTPWIADRADHLERPDGGPIANEVDLVLAHPIEELPEGHLGLAPVPGEQLRQEPSRVLLVGARGWVRGDVVGQGIGELLDPHIRLAQLLRRLVRSLRRPRDLEPGLLLQLAAQRFEPVAECERAEHVVTVIAGDLLEDAGMRPGPLTQLEPLLERHDARPRVPQADRALEAVERLELLDRVALDGRAQRLAHGAEEIDEDATPQQRIDGVLPRRVAAHQPLQRRRLIRGVVVDVEIRVALAPFGDEVHQPLERDLLPGERDLGRMKRVERPERGEGAIDVEHAEEVVDAVIERIGIALEVQEQVAGIGRRQHGQAALRLDLCAGRWKEQLVDRSRPASALDLDPRLLADAFDAARARPVERRLERQGSGCQAGDRVDLARDEALALAGTDTCHEGEVVIRSSPCLALEAPSADVAVLDRLGVRAGRRVGDRGTAKHGVFETLLGRPVVGHVVVDAQLRHLAPAAEHDVHRLRRHALDDGQLLDVRADLEHGAGLDMPRQLRVRDLVMPWPPDRWAFGVVHPEQEVGVPEPAPIEEGGLVDDVRAARHGGKRFSRLAADLLAPLLVVTPLDGDDGAPLFAQLAEVALLVLDAAPADDVELAIVAVRPLYEARERRALEGGEMLAGQVAHEIRGGKDGRAVNELHRSLQRSVGLDSSTVAIDAARPSPPGGTRGALAARPCNRAQGTDERSRDAPAASQRRAGPRERPRRDGGDRLAARQQHRDPRDRQADRRGRHRRLHPRAG